MVDVARAASYPLDTMATKTTTPARARQRITKAKAKLDAALYEQRAATQAAYDAGVPVPDIAEAWGWKSRQTVYNYLESPADTVPAES